MKRRQFTPEKMTGLLRQAEVELSQGKRVGEICPRLGNLWSYPDSVDGEGLR